MMNLSRFQAVIFDFDGVLVDSETMQARAWTRIAEMFGCNDERAPVWKARRDAAFDEIVRLSNKTRGGGAIRVIGATP